MHRAVEAFVVFPNRHEWVQGNLKEIVQAIEKFKPVAEKQQSLIE